jgi:hypothetical protein
MDFIRGAAREQFPLISPIAWSDFETGLTCHDRPGTSSVDLFFHPGFL